MQELRIALRGLPAQGREITVREQSVWEGPVAEFRMACRVIRPLAAALTLLPLEGGCLVRGRLTGEVALPCDRCAEDTPVPIDHAIETFAPLPVEAKGGALAGDDAGEDMAADAAEAHIVWENGAPLLDVAALCWEEFMLALPLRPLCRPDCKGLCPHCGVNRNEGDCQCAADTGDPRLAVLRNFKVKR